MNSKYIESGVVLFTMCVGFVSCSHDLDGYSTGSAVVDNYNNHFIEAFGTPNRNHTWGFAAETTATPSTRGITRSQSAPSCPDIDAPYDEDWVEDYLLTATEPTQANCWDNYDNSGYATNYGEGGPNYIDYGDAQQVADKNYFFGEDGNTDTWEQRLAWALENHPSWVVYNKDENFVKLFKITDTWNGYINVAASEGYLSDNVTRSNAERTVVVTGTWNINDQNQRIGAFGRIIVADGGTINIAEGKALELVNQARLVVLRGGRITGDGEVMITNGNAEGLEGYNAGTIDIHKVNNNFGKFYNYGVLKADIYAAGAQESNIYNHGKVIIEGTKETGNEGDYYVSSNARIFNACQWWCKGDQRARNIEMVSGSYMQVDGELMMSGSEDGTTDPSYVGLAANSLIKCGTLYNNGTSWSGPTENGYAVVSTGMITYLNWAQDTYPLDYGYFENNIYLQADDLTNVPDGNGYQAGETSTAEWKFKHIVANGLDESTEMRGNGNVKVISKGDTEIITASDDFELGAKGCTPGFSGDIDDDDPSDPDEPDDPDEPEDSWGEWARIIAEDLSVSDNNDFDFNDVVFDVRINTAGTKAQIKLKAAGGTLPLTVGWSGEEGTSYTDYEVHHLYNVSTNKMVNTHAKTGVDGKDDVVKTLTGSFSSANDVKVMVMKSGEWVEITAHTGEPASKILVKPTYEWCNERQNISSKYCGADAGYAKSFNDYVNDPSVASDWYEK